jgi:competence protein ComEC
MDRGALIYVVCASLCMGIGAMLLVRAPLWVALVLVVCSAVGLALAGARRAPVAFLVCTGVLCFGLGMLRAELALRHEASETLPAYATETVELSGRVVADPDERATSMHLSVAAETVNGQKASGTVLATLPKETDVSYNDHVTLKGQLTAPAAFETDTGHTFDYPGYLRAQGISMLLKKASLTSDTPSGFTLLGPLYALKHSFEHSLERLYPEPDGSLEEGILLGEKSGIPQEMTDTFIKSGLVHVVVLSGYNIAVVSEAVFRALSFLPRSLGLGGGALVMVLFSLMTGAGSATMRALLMALVAVLARYLHRSVDALRTLVLAAAAMAAWNPEGLLHDTSFILSVLATFGLVTLSPWVERHLPKGMQKNETVRSIAASTIAVQLFVLPMLLYTSGVLSFLSVPANVLGLPGIPAAMLFGFIAGIAGWVHPLLGFIPAVISDLLLKWLMFVASATASVPFGSITVSEFSPWLLVLAYIPLTWWAVRRYQSNLASSSKAR